MPGIAHIASRHTVAQEAITVQPKYDNLKALLKADRVAYDYFASLPQYVREHVAERSGEVNSMDSLRSHVDNATKGDG